MSWVKQLLGLGCLRGRSQKFVLLITKLTTRTGARTVFYCYLLPGRTIGSRRTRLHSINWRSSWCVHEAPDKTRSQSTMKEHCYC